VAQNHQQSAITSHTSAWAAREVAIAEVAATQHNQVTLTQLVRAGFSDNAIRHRLGNGSLHRPYRGVYSLGRPPVTANEHRMAAVLACGRGAALSHATAGDQLDLRASASALIDVTSPTGAGRRLAGIRAHRSRNLAPCDTVLVDGIPTTSWARTLLDLASTLHPEALAAALDRAEITRVFDLAELQDVLERNPGHHGQRPLRALLTSLNPVTKRTRNDFERDFLELIRDAGLPTPEVNATLYLEGRTIHPDFLWREHRLIAETDGWETHRTRWAFERDRARDQLLLRAHYRTVRVTYAQLLREPATVLATIQAALTVRPHR
jgi:very-short-patch-repair endonuclease